MVTITNYHLRNSKEGKPFISLELQGDIEMVQSMETGRFYATARKCSITSTFDEAMAKSLVGKAMQGNIIRKSCEPYEYTVPESGEVIMLAHTYDYTPEEQPVTAQVPQLQMQGA